MRLLALTWVMCGSLCAVDRVEMAFDFSGPDLDPWRPQTAGWHVQDGRLRHADPFFHGGLTAVQEVVLTETEMTVRLRIEEIYRDDRSTWAGMLFRARDPLRRGYAGEGYLLMIRADGEVCLVRRGANALRTSKTSLRPAEEPVELGVRAVGDAITVSANGETLFEVEDAAYTAGRVALVHFGNAAAFHEVRLQGVRGSLPPREPIDADQPTAVKTTPVTPLPRIGIRPGERGAREFYRVATGEPFLPIGFNHTRLEFVSSGWHALLNVGIYDHGEMDGMLRRMAETGANCIRFWAWGIQNEAGFTGSRDARGLNGAYMENVVDFLRLATRHGIYAMPILDEVPHNRYYDGIAETVDERASDHDVTGYNRQYMTEGPIRSKAVAVRDFIGYIKESDPGLLNTVFAWAFANEVFVNHTEGPFHYRDGIRRTAAGAFDMADPEQRQACWDANVLHWANALAEAVKEVDPDALTTAGMWTSDAHGRDPRSGLLPDDRDPRRPPRPSVLAGSDSRLDFIDIHIYPWDGTSRVRPDAHEAAAVRALGTPVVVGEYGVFKRNTLEEARVMLREMLDQAYALGYQGDLFWVWDLAAVPGQTWSAVEGDLAAFVMDIPRRIE